MWFYSLNKLEEKLNENNTVVAFCYMKEIRGLKAAVTSFVFTVGTSFKKQYLCENFLHIIYSYMENKK